VTPFTVELGQLIQEARRTLPYWQRRVDQDILVNGCGAYDLGWTGTLQENLLKNVANLGAIQEANHIMVVH